MSFYACVSNGVSQPFDLLRARKHFQNFRNFTICVNMLIKNPNWVPKRGEVACKPNVDFFVEERAYRDEQQVRMIPLSTPEQEWIFNIRPGHFFYQRNILVDIQAYVLQGSQCK